MKPLLIIASTLILAGPAPAEDLGRSGFADSGGVKIHYVTAGEGPLLILIHGFPDFWYTWRAQMPELARHYQVVAIDQRGYNLSDQPEGVQHYRVDKLVADVDAVITHFGRDRATIAGHDWGGFVAWTLAMTRPARVERLVILNLPHPRGFLTWNWVDNELTLVTIPGAGHFVQQDASERVTRIMVEWLAR